MLTTPFFAELSMNCTFIGCSCKVSSLAADSEFPAAVLHSD
jgi:hypothetical protein